SSNESFVPKPKLTKYSSNSANSEFSFIDPDFCPIIDNDIEINQSIQLNTQSQNKKLGFIFCPPEHYNHILNLIAKHFNQHPFIPTSDNQYCSPNQIRKAAVKEMYIYCKNNDLKWTWSYLWVEWYSLLKWSNWVQSAKKEISVLRTTMITELNGD
ncbi:3487_t:CDS:2, partial [Dentiscutata erythropus]